MCNTDIDRIPLGAWWGEVHSLVHKRFGIDGAITNGAMRDIPDLAANFQILAGSITPAHAFAHPVTLGEPVQVFGMPVRQGDLLHADRHGAVVIPIETLRNLPDAITTICRREREILDAAAAKGFSLQTLETALRRGRDIH